MDLPAVSNDDFLANDGLCSFQRLKIDADADERAIKRAYARELKLIDQAADPASFQELREACEAALYVSRNAEPIEVESVTVDPFEELGRAAQQIELLPQAASAAYLTLNVAPAKNADPDIEPETMAQDVFAEFNARCAKLGNSYAFAPWEWELRTSLADPRLINIVAREGFEQRIANLLAEGWRPGHQVLLVVATKVFEWERDLRRLQSLGMAGYKIQFAVDQRVMYDLQSDDACEQQRQLIERLRDPAPPSTFELIDLMPTLATIEARFPTWLLLIADADNISRWHRLDQAVPKWRRIVGRRSFGFPLWSAVVFVLVILRVFYSFSSSGGDVPASQSIAARHVVSGNEFLGNDNYKLAVASYDKALAEEPDNASAYAGRAMSLAFLFDEKGAEADIEKLESLAPLHPLLFRARGLLATRERRHHDAAAAFTRSLELDPSNTWTLMRRGEAYLATGELIKALKDADTIQEIEPGALMVHRLRAGVFIERKEIARAKAEADAALLAANKHGDGAYRVAAFIYREIGDRPGAAAIMQKAATAFPNAGHHLDIASLRPASHTAARRADIEAALALEPSSSDGLVMLVRLELEAKQWDNAIRAVDRAMKHESTKSEKRFLMASRGIVHAKRGESEKANEDFAAARLAANTSVDLNNLCYELASNDVALNTALASCEMSLEQRPNSAHTLDSKAFALMRLKRYAEALPAYDTAVKANGKLANAWYGRGLVRYRLHDKAGGQADINAALAIDPDIGEQFARMGLAP